MGIGKIVVFVFLLFECILGGGVDLSVFVLVLMCEFVV